MSSDDIEMALARAAAEPHGVDRLAELGDLTLDRFVSNDFLKDVPIIGMVFRTLKTGSAIRELMLASKVLRFLVALKSVESGARETFQRKIEQDPKFAKSVGTTLLLILDKFTDMEKPTLLGHSFGEYLNGQMEFVTFRRLADALDLCLAGDLTALPLMKHGALASPTMHSLARAGLVEIRGVPGIPAPGAENTYRRTWLGNTMIAALGPVLSTTSGE